MSIAVTLRRPAHAPCIRRTSRASSHRVSRCASRARRGRPPHAAARSPDRLRRAERSRRRIDAPRQPSRDLLQQPAVAVRVAERHEGAVAGVIGRGAPQRGRRRRAGTEPLRPGVEHLADLRPASGKLVARAAATSETIRWEPCAEPGAARRYLRAELHRTPRPRRRKLNDPKKPLSKGKSASSSSTRGSRRTSSRDRHPRPG